MISDNKLHETLFLGVQNLAKVSALIFEKNKTIKKDKLWKPLMVVLILGTLK